jgi:hypothetical protein
MIFVIAWASGRVKVSVWDAASLRRGCSRFGLRILRRYPQMFGGDQHVARHENDGKV